MTGIIMGMILGAAVGASMMLVTHMIIYELSVRHIDCTKIFASGMVIVVIAGALIGFNLDKHCEHIYLERYLIKKRTIEDFMLKKTATDIEKMEIVKTAVELNSDLAEKKYSADKWYGFAVDKKVLEMEYIRVTEQ